MRQNHKAKESLLEEIDHEAKREWRNVLKFKNENHWLFMGFVTLIAALVIVNSIWVVDKARHPRSATIVATSAVSTEFYKSGQIVQTNDFEAIVDSVTERPDEDKAFPLSDNETMLIFNLSIKNKTAVTQNFIPDTQLFIHDSDGSLYRMHASMFITKPLAAQELKPGQTAHGQVSFAILKNQTRPLLYVQPGWSDQAPAVFDVLH